MEKRCLLVIDMLNDFIDPKGALYIGSSASFLESNVREFVKNFSGQKYFLCDNHEEDDKEFERFPKHAISGGWGQAIIDGLVNIGAGDIIIPKTRYSGFFRTNLEMRLLYSGFLPNSSEVTVIGCVTSICVLFTVADLVNRDYKVIIPKKCISDFDLAAHEFSLKHMKNVLGVNII